jgi:hypothetical protein
LVLEWAEHKQKAIPYIIITTLPDKESPEWQLRYTSKDQYNHEHKGKISCVRNNPFKYWYRVYSQEIKDKNIKLSNIQFFNIDGKKVEGVELSNSNKEDVGI